VYKKFVNASLAFVRSYEVLCVLFRAVAIAITKLGRLMLRCSIEYA
jgi:hypothetical protein